MGGGGRWIGGKDRDLEGRMKGGREVKLGGREGGRVIERKKGKIEGWESEGRTVYRGVCLLTGQGRKEEEEEAKQGGRGGREASQVQEEAWQEGGASAH